MISKINGQGAENLVYSERIQVQQKVKNSEKVREQEVVLNETLDRMEKLGPNKIQLSFIKEINQVVAKIVSPSGEIIETIPSEQMQKLHLGFREKGLFLNKER